ncbi:MAG: dihydrolipoyl dehydrogenase family protein [Puniceicoccaceae bacterium]
MKQGPLQFEYIVIGGGSAGYAAARTAREFTESVAIVDGASELGGLCILRGCMPSKTLIYTTELLHHAKLGRDFGLRIPEATPDLPAIIARKNRIIAEFADYRRSQLESSRFSLFRQRAKFIAEDVIELGDGTQLQSPRFLISTGSQPAFPPIPGLSAEGIWTSDDILSISKLPPSVIVLGGGIVACELSQYLARLGTTVTQIQRSERILKDASPEASEVVQNAFRKEGIHLYTNTKLIEISKSESGFDVTFEHAADRLEVSATNLFNALGRRPATDSLGLDLAGVETSPSGHLRVDGFLATTNPRIYAAGDCAGPHEIVHIAIQQGEIAARHAFGKPTQPISYHDLMGVTFTDPQVASVGLSTEDLAAHPSSVIEASYPFDDHGKSILMEAKQGFVRCFAERSSGTLLRAECVGKDAGELIHALSFPVSVRADVRQVMRSPWYHPTLAEIWSYPLEELAELVAES